MALIDKIFSKKGNRQFTKDEDALIDALNNTIDFIADEAYINFTHTELFAIDKELGKFLKIDIRNGEFLSQVLLLIKSLHTNPILRTEPTKSGWRTLVNGRLKKNSFFLFQL